LAVPSIILLALCFTGCGRGSGGGPIPAPPNTVTFAVFGDAPYSRWEEPLFQRLLGDVGSVRPDFFLHVGDILGSTCTDEVYLARRSDMEGLPVPVVYTPGDNEWVDCGVNGWDPLDRLRSLRQVFFTGPWAAENRRELRLVSQETVGGLAFPENVRFQIGSIFFATGHFVGSGNGTRPFPGRNGEHDREVEERAKATLAWFREAFQEARGAGAPLLVLAFHADPYFEGNPEDRPGHQKLIELLAEEARAFDGEVLAVHGDSHELHFDHPLVDPGTQQTVGNFTRLETFGSPDVGWVQVVVDTLTANLVTVRPYLCQDRWNPLTWAGIRKPGHCVLQATPEEEDGGMGGAG